MLSRSSPCWITVNRQECRFQAIGAGPKDVPELKRLPMTLDKPRRRVPLGRVGRIAYGGPLALSALVVANLVFERVLKVDRADLGMPDGQPGGNCQALPLPNLWRMEDGFPDYNTEAVADQFGLYAAYS